MEGHLIEALGNNLGERLFGQLAKSYGAYEIAMRVVRFCFGRVLLFFDLFFFLLLDILWSTKDISSLGTTHTHTHMAYLKGLESTWFL